MIARLDDMQLLVPRGKYVFNLYSNYLRLHGKTHDYKISFKDINRAFLLPRPDGVHMNYIISLRSPLRQGQTAHNYLVLQFKKEREENLTLNLSEEEIDKKYGGQLARELSGPLYDVLSRLFKVLINISIITAANFKSEKGTEAVKCSVRAQDGYLYPLQKSFMFIHKPVSYIRHEEIQYLEFNRISEFAATGRSFDINIVTKKNGTMSFTGISKPEFKPIVEYLKSKKIKCRNGDDEGKLMDLNNLDSIENPTRRANRRAMEELEGDDGDFGGEAEDSEGEDEDFDIAEQEQEDSELESHGSESLIEESDDNKKKSKKKSSKKKSKEEAKE
jgi:structure-specific recognition protein 1